ncbi:amidase [uncultured Pseudacidovorax sp.]|uniref:amidase n=1 Tax=uncultured Pseudacidovorax sp. TaxID=679313 RepID=UPI0025F72C91|nr:amidase [uncultured Pseudacidovorax sp.]
MPPTHATHATHAWQMTAEALSQAFARRTLSPVEALLSVLGQADAVHPRLNALVVRDDAAALAAAQASEARWHRGTPLSPLDGVPLTVKDNIPVAGLPCRWGSRLFADHRPARDESPVARLRAGGMVILGKTNVPEFTLQGYTDNPLFGPTGNPWAPALTPGGSSGGAVAAVAAGIGPLALGTDGGGSIRRPCGFTGLYGFKPGRGVVPRADGLPVLLPGLEEVGPIARSMGDVQLALRLLAPGLAPLAHRPGPLRIACWRAIGDGPVDAAILARSDAAAERLRALGHTVVEQPSLPEVEAFNRQAWPVIASTGLAAVLRGHPEGVARQLSPALAGLLAQGRAHTAVDLFQAQALQRALAKALQGLFGQHDLLLTPASAALPWPADESHPGTIAGRPVDGRGHAVFTAFVNGAGLPALALPAGPTDDGLPVGLQLVAPRGGDALLCAVGAMYEREAAPAWCWPPALDKEEMPS